MKKKRVTVEEPDKIRFSRVLLELGKTVLSGIVRALAAEWLHRH